jgi:protein involved in ribonucleotide reduction
LATWFEDPIQRQADGHYNQKQKSNQLSALDLLSLKNLIVVILLAVCGKRNFGSDFCATATNVGESVDNPATDSDHQNDPSNI